MKRKLLRERGLALLLVLVLALGMVPTAFALNAVCPACHSTNCTVEVVLEANCHEKGIERYVCANCGRTTLQETAINLFNHDAVCVDNGDGLTHTATCRWHPEYANVTEEHRFGSDGRCAKCLAVNYAAVQISLPRNLQTYVAVGDTAAALSLGDVSLTLGGADVTSEYEISYNWYYGGRTVGEGKTYALPAAMTAAEGDYTYVCFLMAVARNNPTSTITASCTVSVLVRDLITADAAVSGDDVFLDMSDTNSRTPSSIMEQIYAGAYDLSVGIPSYVVFGDKPLSKVGNLKSSAGTRYYFQPANASQAALASLRFEPSKEETGTYVINFTVYDNQNRSYPGVLTIAVDQSLGSMDVLYTTTKETPVDFAAADFEQFWQETYVSGRLSWVSFTKLPTAAQGALYTGYTSALRPGTKVKMNDLFYAYTDRANQTLLDEVTFVPAARYTGYVTIPFEAYGQNNRGAQTYLSGSVSIFVSDGQVSAVQYAAGSTVKLSGEDFLAVYRAATGSKTANFYIQLLEVPTYGDLYLNYTGGYRDTKLNAATVSSYPFYYSSTRGDEIDDLTYVPGAAGGDTVRYAAYDTKGTLLYIGSILFTRGDLTVSYTSPTTGVSFKSSDFEKLLGTQSAGTYLTFKQPAAGTLYYSKTGAVSGASAVTEKDKFYLGYDLMNVSNLLFVPKAGQTGAVSIPFTVYNASGARLSGQVKITVQGSYTKSFTDVKKTDWFYTYVMDLAQAGVIDGMKPGVFDPNGVLSHGQALKMVMLATGYSEQAPTGKHWASGYLSRALADGLVTKTVDLDRNISRYEIAELAAKAMKLPKPAATKSPFSDMAMTHASAPYVLALYEAKIVEGTTQSNGTVKYFGTSAIRRSEVAAIIWRINNYAG